MGSGHAQGQDAAEGNAAGHLRYFALRCGFMGCDYMGGNEMAITTLDFALGFAILGAFRTSGGRLTLDRVGPLTEELSDPINDILLNSSNAAIRRETHVCSQRRLTDDRGTHAEKKGPLQYVNRAKSTEDRKGWGNPGNGQVLDPAKTPTSRSHDIGNVLTRTYRSRTSEQARTESNGLSQREGVCLGDLL